jgi:hypothetical protein
MDSKENVIPITRAGKETAVSRHYTPYHTDAEVPYCYGVDAITGECGWFCFKETSVGRVATTPLFEEWFELLFYMNQEGYTFSRVRERMFEKRPAVPPQEAQGE